jgi:hypothetical protein
MRSIRSLISETLTNIKENYQIWKNKSSINQVAQIIADGGIEDHAAHIQAVAEFREVHANRETSSIISSTETPSPQPEDPHGQEIVPNHELVLNQ